MSTYETVVVIGMALWILVALGILVGLAQLIPLLRPLGRAAKALDGLEERLAPLIRNAERASEDVNYIIASLRADVGHVGSTVGRVTEATERMVAMVEERVAEISGLLEVVQEEAEETFLSTASLLRGMRGGREAAEGERRRRTLRGGSP